MKNRLSTALLVILFFAGLGLLLYPAVSNYWNGLLQSGAVAAYDEVVDEAEEAQREILLAQAEDYNRRLRERGGGFSLPEDMEEEYRHTLLLGTTEVMAYLEIPSIGVTLPIAHGTEADTLEKCVGHLDWSSLPVGGESTHCVLSGHRGLPSSELLTNIDRLEPGDAFYLHVLGRTLEYRVDRVQIVEPDDVSALGIVEGKDYVTLVTCTPYGINSHRLLVRGVRIQDNGGGLEDLPVSNEVTAVDTLLVVTVAALALAAAAFLFLLFQPSHRATGDKKRKKP